MAKRGVNVDNDVLLTHIKDIKADVQNLNKRLFGNGQEGLMDRVKALETTQVEHEKNETRWKYIFTSALLAIGLIITIVECLV